MTNPQHEALVEAVAAAIEQELDVQEMLLADPMTLRRLKARRIARTAIAALSATAATPSDEEVRLRDICRANNDLARMNAKGRDEWRAKAVRLSDALEAIVYEAEREQGGWAHLKRAIAVAARAALEPKAKDVCCPTSL